MLRFQVWLGVVVLLVAFTAIGECQVAQPWLPGNTPGAHDFCKPQPPQPKPVSRTVQVDVPVPCAPPVPRMPAPACAPYGCGPTPCPPPCPTRPIQVRVDVVVRQETPKPCVPQRYCCENPPVFEPVFYHAASMLGSVLLAPLGLGENVLGHGMPRQLCPPPIPVACVSCRAVQCPHPVQMCQPPVPQCMPSCQPVASCAMPAGHAQFIKRRPQQPRAPHGNLPIPR
jgi:hypothetical protein